MDTLEEPQTTHNPRSGCTFGLPFSWSPDGPYCVYGLSSDDWGYDNGTLWILDINTGEKRQLTFNPNPPD